jgi:hypothetical protein
MQPNLPPGQAGHGPELVRRNTGPPAGLVPRDRAGFVLYPGTTPFSVSTMKHIRFAAALALGAALFAGTAGAQVLTPPFMSPTPSNDVGIYVSDVGDLGIEGIWRRVSRGGSDIGIRAGYADRGDGALLLGLETRNPVVLAGAPIGLAFTAAAQGMVGDGVTELGAQAGFTAGQAIRAPTFTVTPFIHPRLAVIADLDEADGVDDEREVELDVLADIGADFDFASGISLRLDFNLAEGANWGVGLAWRP